MYIFYHTSALLESQKNMTNYENYGIRFHENAMRFHESGRFFHDILSMDKEGVKYDS
jgi:hypothetical protein